MLANLRALLAVMIDIVLLRRGPEQLPTSSALLVVVIITSTVASAFLGVVTGQALPISLLQAAVASAVMLVWFRFLLALSNKRERFLQTLTALFGISTLFAPLLIPLLPPLLPYFKNPDPASTPPSLPFFLATALCFWALLCEVRVVRAAFESPWLVALMIVIGEIFAAGLVGMLIFGSPAQPA